MVMARSVSTLTLQRFNAAKPFFLKRFGFFSFVGSEHKNPLKDKTTTSIPK